MSGEPQRDLFTPAPLPVAPLDERGRLACLRLIRTEGVGAVTFRELVNTYGGAEEALRALPEIARRAGRSRPLVACAADRAEAELTAARAAGAQPVFTIEPGYPPALAVVDAPPPLLYVRGSLAALATPMVALVGSRDCSAAGATMAQRLAVGLGAAGLVVSSGLARGIDAAAHRAALSQGTVAVLAGGIDHIYPPEHGDLYRAIPDAGGAVVSEMSPGHNPRAQDFPRRNRIISGISLAVVVVEAARRSGGLITARFAGEQGREVFAVPGHPLDPRAEGTNHLLKQGATLVTEVADILDALGPITGTAPVRVAEPVHPVPVAPVAASTRQPSGSPSSPPPSSTPPSSPPSSSTGEDHVRREVLAALGPAPVSVDVLVRVTGLPTRHVQIALMELDLAGALERHAGQLVSRRGG